MDREELAQRLLSVSIQTRQNQLARISSQVKLTDADYKEQIENIRKSEESTTASLNQAKTKLQIADADLRIAKDKVAKAAEVDRPVLTEQQTALWRTKERFSEQIDAYTQRLTKFTQLRAAWQRRYQIATADPSDIGHESWVQFKTAQDETKKVLEYLATDLRMQITKMQVIRSSLASVSKKAEAAAKGPPEIALQIEVQQTQLEETLRIYEKNLISIETSRRIHEKLLDELSPLVEALTPMTLALDAWHHVEAGWNSTLPLDIGGQSIKVGDTVKGLTILIFGWMLSRSTSGIFRQSFFAAIPTQ